MTDDKPNAVVLGITGGIACGKSEVGKVLLEMGFMVCDADRVAHDLMKKGTPVYQKVLLHFGKGILKDGGEISRPILGAIIFKDPAERKALDRMVHPAVREKLEDWMATARQRNADAAVLIPLLFEGGMDTLDWDAIVCVSSSEDVVLHRLKNRGLKRTESEQRVGAHWPLADKEKNSDYVLPNLGTLKELEHSTRATVNRIKTERGL